jgi:hypothetical protein
MALKELEVLPETATDSVALPGAIPGTGMPEGAMSLIELLPEALAESCPASL